MRLWSFHPMHLDDPGLRSVWRYALEAMRMLRGEPTLRGNHPQLDRWRAMPTPINAIGTYLVCLEEHATGRGLHFKKLLIPRFAPVPSASCQVTSGQLAAEWKAYLRQLQVRDVQAYEVVKDIKPRAHPLFTVVPGEIEAWDRGLLRC